MTGFFNFCRFNAVLTPLLDTSKMAKTEVTFCNRFYGQNSIFR